MSIKEKIIRFATAFEKNEIAESYPLNYCIPVYHTVSDESLPHLKHLIQYKNTKEFEKDLEVFSQHFQFVNWEEFKDFQERKLKPKKKIALLTFDDGLSEFHNIVAPVLERKGIYAINFVNPKFIGNHDLMFRCKASLLIERLQNIDEKKLEIISRENNYPSSRKDFIQKIRNINFFAQHELDDFAKNLEVDFESFLHLQKPYMTLEQLQSLTQKGFGISSHGWDHPLYHELNLEEQLQNTNQSFEFLKEHHFLSESFAFPFTDFGVKKEFFDKIFNKGNLFCSFGSAGLKLDSFEKNLQRIPMENGKNAKQILKEEIAYFKLKKILNKNTIHRK